VEEVQIPAHTVAIVGMGLMIIDNADLEALAANRCAAEPLGVHVQRSAPTGERRHQIAAERHRHLLKVAPALLRAEPAPPSLINWLAAS
jgi:hypothetical protein